MRVMKIVQAGLFAWICSVLPAAGPQAAEAVVQVPKNSQEDRLMLFALTVGGRQVLDAFPGYADGAGGYRLPLGEFSRALGLGIRVGDGAGTGFVRQETEPFNLDLAKGQVRVGGRSLPLDRSRVERMDEDLYVEAALLETWLEVKLSVDPGRAVVGVEALRELPVQAVWARDQRLASLAARPGKASGAQPLPWLDSPYTFWEPPFVNQTLELGGSSATGKGTVSGSTFLAGDLLYMTSTMFFTSREGAVVDNVRGTLARRDPSGGLLGPLGARVVQVGDIHVPSLALIGGNLSGRGFHVGNGLDRWQAAGNRHTFRGDLLPGWTVELHHNDILVAFQTSRADGTYEFPEVPLAFGENAFRLIFIGPEGQRREETRRLDLRQPLTPPGTFLYNAAGTWTGSGPGQYQGEFSYGINRQLEATFALAQVATDPSTSPRRFGTVSLSGYLPGFWAAGTLARDWAGGTAASGTLGTSWGAQSLSLQHTVVGGLRSPEFRSTPDLRSRSRGLLSTDLSRSFALPVQFTLGAGRDRLGGGIHHDRASLQVATHAGGYSFANELVWEQRPGVMDSWGTFRTGWSRAGFGLRGDASYELGGRARFRSLALHANTLNLHPWLLQGRVQRDLLLGENQLGLQLNRNRGRLAVNLKADYAPSTKLTVGLGLQVSLGWEPRSRRYLPSASPMAMGGAVSARSFLDTPEAAGGSVVEGAALSVDGVPRQGLPAPPGIVFQPHLDWGREVAVGLNAGAIEDPFLKSRNLGYRFLPRPGKTVRLDFPMVVSGEISGSARILTARGPRDLAGLALELVDGSGKVCREVASAFDGFFEVTGLLPDTYVLRVAEREADRLNVTLPATRTFAINASGSSFEGVIMLVTPRTTPQPIPPDPVPARVPAPAPDAPVADPLPRPGPAREVGPGNKRMGGLRSRPRVPLARPAGPMPPPPGAEAAAGTAEGRGGLGLFALPVFAIPFAVWLFRIQYRLGKAARNRNERP